MTLSEELAWRGFTNQTTYKDPKALDGDPITFYWGVDPSSDSMTIGNLAAAMMVKIFIRHGHKAILLVGGATGLIGDPDGKIEERIPKTRRQIARNTKAIASQYEQLFGGKKFELVNNNDWFSKVHYISFLRNFGKHIPMREMLGRDFVETRLSHTQGISYAEFSYALIQAYDFYYLNKYKSVTLQVCGSDQWGNSITGVSLIRRKLGKEAHVYSMPLIVNKLTGKKFGKSEEGAIWLDANKTSAYKFYQHWLNVDDASVRYYLNIFTELNRAEIDDIINSFEKKRNERLAQKTLAFEVTKLVHGLKAAKTQEHIADVLFGHADALYLTDEEYAILSEELPTVTLSKKISKDELIEALVKTELASSKKQARQFIDSGAVYVNGQKIQNNPPDKFWYDADASAVVLRRGKNTNALLRLI